MTFPEQYAAVVRYARDLETLRSGAAHAVATYSPAMLIDYLQETGHPLAPIAAAASVDNNDGSPPWNGPNNTPEWGKIHEDSYYGSMTGRLRYDLYHHSPTDNEPPEYRLHITNPFRAGEGGKADAPYRVRVAIPAGDDNTAYFRTSLSPQQLHDALAHISGHADTPPRLRRQAETVRGVIAARHPEINRGD